jgi:predicted transcriptional regulator of viral defense system
MKLEWDIIKQFSEKDTPCFSYEDVVLQFQETNTSYLAQVLSKMVDNNMLIKLRRGLYYVVPLDQSGKEFMPNWHLVAKYLMRGKNYYIGYYLALQVHNLITQPSLTEIIVTDKQIKPSQIEINGVRFQFVYHKKDKFFGSKNTDQTINWGQA